MQDAFSGNTNSTGVQRIENIDQVWVSRLFCEYMQLYKYLAFLCICYYFFLKSNLLVIVFTSIALAVASLPLTPRFTFLYLPYVLERHFRLLSRTNALLSKYKSEPIISCQNLVLPSTFLTIKGVVSLSPSSWKA